MVQAAVNAYLEEKINAEAELIPLDWSVFKNRMTLMLQSQEDLDLAWVSDWVGYYTFAENGILLPLDKLLGAYGRGIISVTAPILLSGPVYKGKLYGLPTNKEIAQYGAMYFKSEIIDKYGFDVNSIKYLKDLEPWWQTIKENEPDLTPIYFSTEDSPINWLRLPVSAEYANDRDVRYFDVFGGSRTAAIRIDVRENKAVYAYDLPDVEAFYRLIRDWYLKGYINQDASVNQTNFQDQFNAGKSWQVGSTYQPGQLEFWQNALNNTPLTLLKGGKPLATTSTCTAALTAIPAVSRNPERAMMLINLMYTDPYLVNLINYGVEGRNYVMRDGRMQLPEGVSNWGGNGYQPGVAWEFGNAFLLNELAGDIPDKYQRMREFNSAEVTMSPLFGFVFIQEPVKTEIAAVLAAIDEYALILENGLDDTDKTLSALKDKVYGNGMQKIIDEVQRQYDEWRAGK